MGKSRGLDTDGADAEELVEALLLKTLLNCRVGSRGRLLRST